MSIWEIILKKEIEKEAAERVDYNAAFGIFWYVFVLFFCLFFSLFFLCLFSFVFLCLFIIFFPPRPTAKTYDRTEHGEVQKVLCNSRWLGKITNFHVVEVVLLDVIKFMCLRLWPYIHFVMDKHNTLYFFMQSAGIFLNFL